MSGRRVFRGWLLVFYVTTCLGVVTGTIGLLRYAMHIAADPSAADAVSAHLDNSVAATLEIHAFANIRNMPKLSQQKTGQRLHAAIARQVPMHLRFQITEVYAAVQIEGLRGHAGSAAHAHIELILHLADQLFQRVLHSYQPNRGPMFVNDDRQMPPPFVMAYSSGHVSAPASPFRGVVFQRQTTSPLSGSRDSR